MMTQSDFQQLHAVVHGRVQGVGFRASTQRRAADLGLTGWVRNCADNTVEVRAEGDHEMLERFLIFLKTGPSAAQVSSVEAEWLPATGRFGSFNVR